jgi:DNA-binding response OmpR family regulator
MVGYGKRVLVIDDDAGCRALLEAQLEQEGYAVQTACDGVAGLDEMRKRRFDAVITDCRMPGFIGHEFAGICGVVWPDTPLILLTGALNYLTDYADEFDAAACIRKPYEAAMLLSVLRTVTQSVSTEQATFSMAEMAH